MKKKQKEYEFVLHSETEEIYKNIFSFEDEREMMLRAINTLFDFEQAMMLHVFEIVIRNGRQIRYERLVTDKFKH